MEVQPELVAVADLVEDVGNWFRRIPSCEQITGAYHELLANTEVDVVYLAVPHNKHEKISCAVLAAGKDLFAEKPFGIDLATHASVCPTVERLLQATVWKRRNYRM